MTAYSIFGAVWLLRCLVSGSGCLAGSLVSDPDGVAIRLSGFLRGCVASRQSTIPT